VNWGALDRKKDPIGLFSANYQEGLKHELDEVSYGIKRGKRRSFFEDRKLHYTLKIDYWNRHNEPTEMAYSKGREEVLAWTLYRRNEKPKFYVNYDIEPIDEAEFQRVRNTQKIPDQK